MAELAAEIEATQSFTDLIGGLLLLPVLIVLWKKSTEKVRERRFWLCFFAFLCASCLIGFVTHYYCRDPFAFQMMWILLYPVLYETINAFFLLALQLRNGGARPSRRENLLLHLAGLTFCLVTLFFELVLKRDAIRILAVYGAAVGLSGFALLIRPAFRDKKPGLRLLFLALLPLLPGAYFQLERKTVIRLIWAFNYNGLTHLCVIVSMGILFAAALCSLSAKSEGD